MLRRRYWCGHPVTPRRRWFSTRARRRCSIRRVSGPMPVPHFRADLYRGTAEFYDRFRPPYPDELFVDLRARLPITGTGRLLDVACGTGQVAFPLAGGFVETVAIDLEPEAVAYAQAKDAQQGPTGITWSVGAAETVAVDGTFELITVGTAFH